MVIVQITAFNNHVSIKEILEAFPEISSNDLEFTEVTEECVKSEVFKLNTKKSSASGSIPATILKQSVETYLLFLTNAINLGISENKKKVRSINPFLRKTGSLKEEGKLASR